MEDSYEATIKRIEAISVAIKAKDDAYEEKKKAMQELEEQLAKCRAEIEEMEKERAQIAADQARDDKELEVLLTWLQSREGQVEKWIMRIDELKAKRPSRIEALRKLDAIILSSLE